MSGLVVLMYNNLPYESSIRGNIVIGNAQCSFSVGPDGVEIFLE